MADFDAKVSEAGRRANRSVLLIADQPNWIFERHARMLHRFLGDDFDFTLGYKDEAFNDNDFDLIYPLEWNLVPFDRIQSPEKWITGIRSHCSWGREPFDEFAQKLARHFQQVHVVSRRLLSIFAPHLPGVFCLSHGVDTEWFSPRTQADQSGRKLRLGWAGNRFSAANKGFTDIIEPLGRLPGVELVFCGYSDRNLPLESMREFYDSLDAYVCASDTEGNNNSLMEAASMRRAIITTDTGTVPEYLQNSVSALIVGRNLPAFVSAVSALRDNPAQRVALGAQARVAVQRHFEWSARAEGYRSFFKEALAQASAKRLGFHITAAPNPTATANVEKMPADNAAAGSTALLPPKPSRWPLPPQISVILPTYNRPEILERCLDGFAAQTLAADQFEVVVLDDGSEPPVRKTVERFAGRLQVHYAFQSNQGLAAARNAAIHQSSADWLALHDDDDVPAPDYLERCLTFHRTNPDEADILLAQVKPDPSLTSSPLLEWLFDINNGIIGFPAPDEVHSYRHFYGGTSSCKRSLFSRAQYNPQYRFGFEDMELALRLNQHVKLRVHYDPLTVSHMIRETDFKSIFRRSYREGRSLRRSFDQHGRPSLEMSPPDIERAAETIESLEPSLLKLLNTLGTLEAEGARGKTSLTLDGQTLEGIPALKACYSLCSRYARARGWLDFSKSVAETLGIQRLEAAVRENLVEGTSPLAAWKPIPKRVVAYFHSNPYPPHSGAHRRVLSTLQGLRRLGYEVTLVSRPTNDNPPWTDAGIAELYSRFGIRARVHPERPTDAPAPEGQWHSPVNPSLKEFFHAVCAEVRPEMVLINYAYCWDLVAHEAFKGITKLVEMHDLVSLGHGMSEELGSLLYPEPGYRGSDPLDMLSQMIARRASERPTLPARNVSRLVREDLFRSANLQVATEELRRYAEADGVIAISQSEAAILRQGDHAPNVECIPVACAAAASKKCYDDPPLLVIFPNAFNLQGYLYFVERVLPKIRARVPNFKLRIVGDACRYLTPEPGVELLGYVPDLNALYATAGFAICPLIGGTGQQVKIVEAMSRGVPVVALENVAGSSPIVHEQNGLIASDSERFADAVVKLATDPELRRRLGTCARETVASGFAESAADERLAALIARANARRMQTASIQRGEPGFARLGTAKTCSSGASDNGDRYVMVTAEQAGYSGLLPVSADLASIAKHLCGYLSNLGSFYAHFGGAGDALLLLSTFLDQNPTAQVVSFPNSIPAARDFFDAFPSLRKVFFLPKSGSPEIHLLLRMIMRHVPKFQGMGVTPEVDYFKEWHSNLNIFQQYRVCRAPKWTSRFRTKPEAKRVVLAPKGSVMGMVGSKRNIIDPAVWPELLEFVLRSGYDAIIIGTPGERTEYPAIDGCDDRRSLSFQAQMEHIANSSALIGADSWAKTFSALAGIPTIVFEALKGRDWAGKKDASDFVFLDPWEDIVMVRNLEECKEVFAQIILGGVARVRAKEQSQLAKSAIRGAKLPQKWRPSAPPVAKMGALSVAWEGSFLDLGSLSHVNRQITACLAGDAGVDLHRISTTISSGFLGSEFSDLAQNLVSEPPKGTRVTVRHSWPPDWKTPHAGALVVIQPWEYGSLPQQWVRDSACVKEFWVPSNHVREVYIQSGIDAAKVVVVPNGVDPARFNPEAKPFELPTKKSFKFLFVGGTIHRKGPDLLLRAYLNTFSATDDVCLVVKDFGGQGVYAGQTLEAQIKAAQAQPNTPEILYLNEELPTEAIAGLYTACDCLVHPYRGEGFGLPVLEAMACGLPVITTAGGATDDFASEEHVYRVPAQRRSLGREVAGMPLAGEGWLLEPSLGFLSQAMRRVTLQPEEATARGRLASDFVRREWTWERAARIAASRIQAIASGQNTAQTNQVAGQQTSTQPERPAARKAVRLVLPDCALVGDLRQARATLGRKRFSQAWMETLAALSKRPFHPEAFLLLGEIALAAGDASTARQCARHAAALAPGWRPARRFLQGKLRGNLKHDWLKLPEAVRTQEDSANAANGGTGSPPRLSACLITRNEEKFLGRCLASIQGLVQEIVVVDTGSTDRTIEIAKEHGAKVFHFDWCDDFSAARNAALEHVTGDWVLVLDADEEVPSASHQALREHLVVPSAVAWRLPMADSGRETEGCSYVPRLFRNAPALFYVGRVHEQVFTSIEVRREEWGLENRLGHARLLHHGYAAEVVKQRNKVQRNLALLERAIEEMPDEPHLLMNYGLELVRSGRLEAGVGQYRRAFQLMSAQHPSHRVPETREMLLAQFTTQLMALRAQEEIISVLTSPLAVAGGLNASLHFTLGLVYLERKQFSDAAEQMRQCLAKRYQASLVPVNTEIHSAGPRHCLALSLEQLGQNDAAAEQFRLALEEAPKSLLARADYARFLGAHGEPVEALNMYFALAKDEPLNPGIWLAGANLALSRPEFLEVALDWTSAALENLPKADPLVRSRAEALTLAGECETALPLWNQLTAGHPEACNAAALAALILCQAACKAEPSLPSAGREVQVSSEFVKWYQRLLTFQNRPLVEKVNDSLDVLERALPSAARMLSSALAQATAVA